MIRPPNVMAAYASGSRMRTIGETKNAMQAAAQSPLDVAGQALGLDENGQRMALQDYLSNGGQNLDPQTTAWCAAFVNATLGQMGVEGTGSLAARSFLDWGEGVDNPSPGDVVVLSRGEPGQGHVGFFHGYDPSGRVRVLGGNQGDAVSVSAYDRGRVLGYRRNPMAAYAGV